MTKKEQLLEKVIKESKAKPIIETGYIPKKFINNKKKGNNENGRK